MSRKSGKLPGHSPKPPLPDIGGICRAKPHGAPGLVLCLVPHPDSCNYVLNFGGLTLCHHPHSDEIIARTQANPQ